MRLFELFLFSILQIWYIEVRISRSISESPVEFEITRVDCMSSEEVTYRKAIEVKKKNISANIIFLNNNNNNNNRLYL